MPSDSRYELIRSAALALSESSFSDEEDARDALYELSQDLCSLSSYELLQWFSANLSRLSDCDEALEETGSHVESVSDALDLGYRRAAESVLSVLISEIEENRLSLSSIQTLTLVCSSLTLTGSTFRSSTARASQRRMQRT